MIKPGASLSILLLAYATTASAQLISIRTVPVSQAHQFEIFPSSTMSMGGVSLAVADSLLEPFSNPAKGTRLGATRFFGSPSVYSVSNDAGAGRTLPLGAMTRGESWYGGVWFALQEVDASDNGARIPVPQLLAMCPTCGSEGIDFGSSDRSHANTYAFAMAGRELSEHGLSVGASVLWSRLRAIDGVDLLYAGSAHIEQFGHAFDMRVGVVKEWTGDRSLELVALHNRFGTTHDVYYLDSFWDPGQQQFGTRPRLEQNLDRTNTWGLHLAYQQPLSHTGWRFGALATVNQMDHPKIPNYAIMNIPRDPGHSSAFNIGLGVGRTLATSRLGIDVIYEPIWSHTWADAATAIEDAHGGTIAAGGMTIENRFRFSNAHVRMGLDQEIARTNALATALQLGLAVRSIDYRLQQHDHVQITSRRQHESWTEWTPTWGLSVRVPDLEIRYHGSVTNGTGRPGVQPGVFAVEGDFALGGRSPNILAAPSGPLTLTEVRVMTHQISLSLPLR
jgi:hypothetical protein